MGVFRVDRSHAAVRFGNLVRPPASSAPRLWAGLAGSAAAPGNAHWRFQLARDFSKRSGVGAREPEPAAALAARLKDFARETAAETLC